MKAERAAGAFLDWCYEHHNSPDVTNLKWWLEHRAPKSAAKVDLGETLAQARAAYDVTLSLPRGGAQ